MSPLSLDDLSRRLELALSRAAATASDVEQLCADAARRKCYGVVVHGSRVELARARLEDTELKLTAFVGYPLGDPDSDVKRYETEVAIDHGAHEIEMVLSLGRLKEGDRRYVLRELRDVVEAADERPVKVVLESGLLTVEERMVACELVLDSGAQGVVTGTGARGPSTAEEVRELRALLGPKFLLKAAGEMDEEELACALAEAGANRIGCRIPAATGGSVPRNPTTGSL